MKTLLPPIKPKSIASVVPDSARLSPPKSGRGPADSVTSLTSVVLHSNPGSRPGSGNHKERPLSAREHQTNRENVPSRMKKKERKDSRGIAIDKLKKGHHIAFRDFATGKSIAEVKDVESYKDYNRLNEEPTSGCSCLLL